MTRGDFESIIDEVSALRCKEVILKAKREFRSGHSDVDAVALLMPLDLITYLPKE